MPAIHHGLQVRAARRDELDALLALEQASFHVDRISRRQYRHHLGSPRAEVLVGLRGGSLVGSALLLFRHGARVARLYSLAVDAAWRGRGVGRGLLETAERRARRRGCTRMRLEVRADNRVAQELYQRHGYRRFARQPDYYADGSEAWRYEKALTD